MIVTGIGFRHLNRTSSETGQGNDVMIGQKSRMYLRQRPWERLMGP